MRALDQKPDNVVNLHTRQSEANEQVLKLLVSRHGAALRAFLRRRRIAEEEQEDIAQEVYARLARMEDLHDKLLPNENARRAFLYTIANNLIVDMERRKAIRSGYVEQQRQTAQHNPESCEAGPESLLSASEDIERVRQVIQQMRPNWRRAFILSRFKYWSYREIADDMGVSVKQIEKYMKNALLKIRDVVDDRPVRRGEKKR